MELGRTLRTAAQVAAHKTIAPITRSRRVDIVSSDSKDCLVEGRGVQCHGSNMRLQRTALSVMLMRFPLSPLRALVICFVLPTACAVGCILAPLRGLARSVPRWLTQNPRP